MKTHDFYQPLTSAQLNENLEKQFGGRVNLVKYTREELEDMRNKLRTRIFQQEGSAGINELLTNETYQKDKTMMQLLNTRIKEMLGENIKALKDKMIELSEGKKSYKMPKQAKGSRPDFLDIDNDGNKKEKMKDAAADKKAGPKKGVNPFAKVKETIKKELEGNAVTGGLADKSIPVGSKIPGTNVVKKKQIETEGFPTVADAEKAAAGTAGMKQGEKKKSSTGGEITKTATGLKHTAGKNYGGQDAPKTPDSDKKAKKVKEDTDSESKTDKLPSMAHIKKMCKDGKTVAEICKMHPNCDHSELKQMVADCKKKMVKESAFKHNVQFVNESLQYLINEDEEGKAKAITAASDIVNDFTSWMQRVGQYQTKAIIELADAIKADFGAAEAETFKQSVAPALSSTLETLTQQREAISNAVAVLAGEAAPEEPMGQEPGMDMLPEPGMDMSAPDEMNAEPAGDEFAGADAAAGAGTTGREMRESKFARKLAESHSILSKLAK